MQRTNNPSIAAAPALAYYASVQPQALWQAAATTGLFIGGFGVYGYATRRDLYQSQYNYLISQLRLKAAVGVLGEEDLTRTNQALR